MMGYEHEHSGERQQRGGQENDPVCLLSDAECRAPGTCRGQKLLRLIYSLAPMVARSLFRSGTSTCLCKPIATMMVRAIIAT